MKVYLFDYYDSWCGEVTDITCVVVAETESAAMGLALEKYPDSSADNWTNLEVDVSQRGVTG